MSDAICNAGWPRFLLPPYNKLPLFFAITLHKSHQYSYYPITVCPKSPSDWCQQSNYILHPPSSAKSVIAIQYINKKRNQKWVSLFYRPRWRYFFGAFLSHKLLSLANVQNTPNALYPIPNCKVKRSWGCGNWEEEGWGNEIDHGFMNVQTHLCYLARYSTWLKQA